jgi:antitoxin (DNA-binding transcriptional repressor) of toxin-antitoxin stability system
MTKTADVKDVAANFTHWLKEVAAGHEVVVTENDRPVARVLAAPTEAILQPATSPQEAPIWAVAKPEDSTSDLTAWIRAHAHQGRPRSHQPVSQSELADELFHRE